MLLSKGGREDNGEFTARRIDPQTFTRKERELVVIIHIIVIPAQIGFAIFLKVAIAIAKECSTSTIKSLGCNREIGITLFRVITDNLEIAERQISSRHVYKRSTNTLSLTTAKKRGGVIAYNRFIAEKMNRIGFEKYSVRQ